MPSTSTSPTSQTPSSPSQTPASPTSQTPTSPTSQTPTSPTSHTLASTVTTADSQGLQLLNAHLPKVKMRGRPKESRVLGRFNNSKVAKVGVKRKANHVSTKRSKRTEICNESNDV
ncbi:uncharacterized protein LOC135202906 [Macrobrachium nipponense]|uniref:uncharacterized protein LOC135202906 n=1 Tax=Macrobrachium nipponense TaxID=159736 RepID=UPI0030C89244